MLVVHVHVHVKPEFIETFKQATIENARQSIRETGVARFDVIQNAEDPTRFILQEVYRTEGDPARHKETAHYAAWRDTVTPMMHEARTSAKYTNLFPSDDAW
jgi:(4S)-4-hydroxy-5-phosphonooxypentane-2,3-dione isomerase